MATKAQMEASEMMCFSGPCQIYGDSACICSQAREHSASAYDVRFWPWIAFLVFGLVCVGITVSQIL